MAHSEIETNIYANLGVDEIVEEQRPFAIKHSVSFGDFIQFAGAIGVFNCIGGPRLQHLAGRANFTLPSPDLLVPGPSDSTDSIIARMGDAGFSPVKIVDLLASHFVAAQDHVDPTISKTPFDSIQFVLDANFFVETFMTGDLFPGNGYNVGEELSPLAGKLRLTSDFELARDPRTTCEWQSFVNNQALMVANFEAVMAKMAILGHDTRTLVDCFEVIPVPPAAKTQIATLPAGKSLAGVQAACAATPFPTLRADPGPATSIAPAPPS
ncbi:hypothetical protein AX16_006343 [Volvariella volvacea WC 439]|nr:hypothetical protein AX16_006343 [Volvariella volvacea WC 439]